MNKLIIITGDLATGKSTYASILSARFKIPYFDKDTLKETLSENEDFKDRTVNLKLSKSAVHVLKWIFMKFALIHQDLILEANFRIEELLSIKEIASTYKYDVLLLNLRGEEKILYSRFIKRLENRHPVHKIKSLENYEEFQKYLYSQRYEEYPFETININCNDFSYQENEEYYSKIEKFLSCHNS